MIQIGGVYSTFCQEEGMLLPKYRNRNGRCIAILFKSIGVRGRLDSPDIELHSDTRKYENDSLSIVFCNAEWVWGPQIPEKQGFFPEIRGECHHYAPHQKSYLSVILAAVCSMKRGNGTPLEHVGVTCNAAT